MPTKWLASALAVGLSLVIGLWAVSRAREQSKGPASQEAPAPVSVPKEEARKFQAAPSLERIEKLYESESKRIGMVDPDPALTQKRLQEFARTLRPEEIKWLEEQALDPKTEGDPRFFATYLLGLSEQAGAVESLTHIALRPVPKLKNDRLEAEFRVQSMQATEALSRFCKELSARDALLDIVSKQADEAIRDRAHRALQACATGKPVEEQDKEVLRKLQEQK